MNVSPDEGPRIVFSARFGRAGVGKRDRIRDRRGNPMRTATVIGARALAVVAVALTTGVLLARESAASTPSATAPGGPGLQSS